VLYYNQRKGTKTKRKKEVKTMTYAVISTPRIAKRTPNDYFRFSPIRRRISKEEAITVQKDRQARSKSCDYLVIPEDRYEELKEKMAKHNAKVDKVREERWEVMEKCYWRTGYYYCSNAKEYLRS
jgi:hypothetical protein